MKIKYFITDVDGVILDRMLIWRAAFIEVFKPFNMPEEFSGNFYYNTLGTPCELQIKALTEKSNINLSAQEIKKLVKNFFELGSSGEIKLFPNVKNTLKELKSQGLFLLATSGSNTDELNKTFSDNGLDYDLILGSDKVPKGDKHIEIFANHFSIEQNEFCGQAILVGDGTTDMQIAARNNIFAIGIKNTIPEEKLLSAGAKAAISNFKEVLDYLH